MFLFLWNVDVHSLLAVILQSAGLCSFCGFRFGLLSLGSVAVFTAISQSLIIIEPVEAAVIGQYLGKLKLRHSPFILKNKHFSASLVGVFWTRCCHGSFVLEVNLSAWRGRRLTNVIKVKLNRSTRLPPAAWWAAELGQIHWKVSDSTTKTSHHPPSVKNTYNLLLCSRARLPLSVLHPAPQISAFALILHSSLSQIYGHFKN